MWVDDFALFCTTGRTQKNKREIEEKWEITDQGDEPRIIVGIQIYRERERRRITIHQGAYIRRILKRFGMANADTVATPMDPLSKLEIATENDLFKHLSLYREAIGALLYASMATRPNITYAIQVLSQFCARPSNDHWKAVKRVLRYLRSTEDLGITYDDLNGHADIYVSGFSDANWGSSLID
jgi:hypothetical protein